MGTELDLVLFATDPDLVGRALAAGIRSFIVDWEWRGKDERQLGADTEINRDRPEDLERLARLGAPRRFCRINRSGPWTADEAEAALGAGATHLLLPMVEQPAEVEELLDVVAGRCAVGILVETVAGVAAAPRLAQLPLSQIYVGLNDLAISRRAPNIFDAVADGMVERLRSAFGQFRFGFGGVTVVDRGAPVPCRLLLAEMARLDCDFSFLRRSFRRDIGGTDMAAEVTRLREYWDRLRRRRPEETARDREELVAAVAAASGVVA